MILALRDLAACMKANIYIYSELGWACIGPATRLDSAQPCGLGWCSSQQKNMSGYCA